VHGFNNDNHRSTGWCVGNLYVSVGTSFNSGSGNRNFTASMLGNLANHGYNRTFHVGLQAVPEPATAFLGMVSFLSVHATRRRRRL
jgi:hypothetical protein